MPKKKKKKKEINNPTCMYDTQDLPLPPENI
jgi:hypothetical protein